MATTPIPIRGQAFTIDGIEFKNTSGAVVTGWTGAACTISKDGAQAASATGTLTEITASGGGGWGAGFITLSASEMTADRIVIKPTITNAGAVMPPPYVIYTSNGTTDIPVNVAGFATAAKTDVEDAVWDASAASHNTAGTTGAKLSAAGGASDPLLNNKTDYPDPDTIGNVLATLGLRPANYIGSVNASTGELPLRVGDAYKSTTPQGHGRVRISHDVTGFDLTDPGVTDIRLTIKPASERNNSAAAWIIDVEADSGSLAASQAQFELESTDTGKLTAGGGYLWFASCLVDGAPFTFGEGAVSALPKGRP